MFIPGRPALTHHPIQRFPAASTCQPEIHLPRTVLCVHLCRDSGEFLELLYDATSFHFMEEDRAPTWALRKQFLHTSAYNLVDIMLCFGHWNTIIREKMFTSREWRSSSLLAREAPCRCLVEGHNLTPVGFNTCSVRSGQGTDLKEIVRVI